ncbi:heparinase II/III domain-containing protein [Clostridium hydrogenum]|uniref:heparinase II/III domain-containing protein n=1 Tax=Clostridium hydrogenum TaxID=2855764 RepID=UPI001F377F90|nr:heparinase II/III family protein [Clostridium hydrogenum]
MRLRKNNVNMPLIEEILVQKKRILAMKSIPSIDFMGYQAYLKDGNRSVFEKQYFERRRLLTTMGLALLIEKNKKNIECLENIIWQVCSEYTWALPAHLTINNNTFDEKARYCIDLFAAETAQTLAEFYELYKEYFSTQIKNRITYEINDRIFEPLLSKKWDWEDKENNWSSVIGSSLGMAAISILKDDVLRQKKIFEKVDKSLNSYLRSFKEDGACTEGVSYWAYGFGYYCYFAEKYKEEFNDDKYLRNPLLKNIANFPVEVEIAKGKSVPFSDAAEDQLPTGILCYCKKQFSAAIPYSKGVSLLEHSECFRWAEFSRNLLWTDDSLNTDNLNYKIKYFEDEEWLIINEKNGFSFAAKAGKNNDSHNHNDVGNFIIGSNNELFLTDFGSGKYTKDYFNDEKRYHILNNRSSGHSVPIINDCEEVFGDYKAHNVHASLLKEKVQFSMDIENVYPKESGLQKFNRLFKINYTKKLLEIEDYMLFTNDNNRVYENFVSKLKPLVENGIIKWNSPNGSLKLLNKFDNNEIEIIEEKIFNHSGEEETVYRTLIKNVITSKKYNSNLLFLI